MKLSTKKFVILILAILSQVRVCLAFSLPNSEDLNKFQNHYDWLVKKLSKDYVCERSAYRQAQDLIHFKLGDLTESMMIAADSLMTDKPIYEDYYELMIDYVQLRNKFARKCNKKQMENEFLHFIEQPRSYPIQVGKFVSITSTSAPVTTTSAPVTTTLAPVTITLAPVTTTLAPVTTTLAPVTTTSAPVTTTPIPVTTTSASVTSTSTPVTTTSAPVTSTSTPVTTTSAPVTPTSTPVTTTLVPVTLTSTQVTTKSVPVISISSQKTPRNLYNPHKTQHTDNQSTIDKICSSNVLGWLTFLAMNAVFFGAINICIFFQKRNYLRTVANRPDEFQLIQV